MTIAFIRHGEPRRSESDPGLTSAGRRMAMEAGQWLASQGLTPTSIQCTPTQRTRDTAEELSLVFSGLEVRERDGEPHDLSDWRRLVAPLRRTPGLHVLVGHHPTLALLLRAFGPPPEPVPVHHYAAALLLLPAEEPAWRIHAAWPGRAAL